MVEHFKVYSINSDFLFELFLAYMDIFIIGWSKHLESSPSSNEQNPTRIFPSSHVSYSDSLPTVRNIREQS